MATVRAGGERRHSEDSGTIIVRVRLFAALRRFLPPGVDGALEHTLPTGATVADLLNAIGVPENVDPTVAINGELAERKDVLPNGADVMVLSPMEGGSRPAPCRADDPRAARSLETSVLDVTVSVVTEMEAR